MIKNEMDSMSAMSVEERVALMLVPGATWKERLLGGLVLALSPKGRRAYIDMKSCQSLLVSGTPLAAKLPGVRRQLGFRSLVVTMTLAAVLCLAVAGAVRWTMVQQSPDSIDVIGGGHKGDNNIKPGSKSDIQRPKTDPMHPNNVGKPGFGVSPPENPPSPR